MSLKTRQVADALLLLGIPLGWTWASVASLMIFRWSMKRARIRPHHVLRSCIYSFDGALWVSVVALGIAVQSVASGSTQLDDMIGWVSLAWGVFALLGFWRLLCAYAIYLRFDHPFATVVASQIIVALLMLNVVAAVETSSW